MTGLHYDNSSNLWNCFSLIFFHYKEGSIHYHLSVINNEDLHWIIILGGNYRTNENLCRLSDKKLNKIMFSENIPFQ